MMQRRDFIKSVVALGGASILDQDAYLVGQSYKTVPPEPDVKRVMIMFKCHFDAGFIDTQKAVVAWYFFDYFPEAIRVASVMRRTGGPRYIWTTGSWLLYEYLEQASSEDRRRMDQAIARGDVAWHALPFNWQSEVIDPSMMAASVALSKSLDRRYGKTTTGAKMSDVPGHTRGLISPIASQNVKYLDIGVNDASRRAELPALFLWKDSRGASLIVSYHQGYGTTVRVPGSDLVVHMEVRGDNTGPHSPKEIIHTYSELRHRYPNAKIDAANLTEIANAIEPYRAELPVITQEIGDSWIYGVGSDPLKIARYRDLARLRQKWIAQRKFNPGDATDLAMLRSVILEPEHTWGADVKTWLDYDHYTPKALAEVLNTKNYKVMTYSWEEKRQDLFTGINALPAPLRTEANASIESLAAKEPQMSSGSSAAAGEDIETTHFVLKIDPKTGAIHGLRNKKTGRDWADPDHPLALFSYQTLSAQDYADYRARYVVLETFWSVKDFGKPDIERFGAKHQDWYPSLAELHGEKTAGQHRFLARLEIHDPEALESGRAAFPRKMYMELILPDDEPAVHLNFYWFNKAATRMPEALWLTFNPVVASQKGWMLEKSGEPISPFDVARGGGRQMHAVGTNFSYKDNEGSFIVEPLDAPLIAMGSKSPLNYSQDQPDLTTGLHCNLFNNAWGTNYVMWYGEDMRYRFVLHA